MREDYFAMKSLIMKDIYATEIRHIKLTDLRQNTEKYYVFVQLRLYGPAKIVPRGRGKLFTCPLLLGYSVACPLVNRVTLLPAETSLELSI